MPDFNKKDRIQAKRKIKNYLADKNFPILRRKYDPLLLTFLPEQEWEMMIRLKMVSGENAVASQFQLDFLGDVSVVVVKRVLERIMK